MSHLTGLTVVPGAGSETLTAAGQTVQYKALATYQTGRAAPVQSDVTDSVTWSASNAAVATMSAAGMATATGIGKTTITAESGGLVASSDVTVAVPSAASGAQPTLSVIPGTATVTTIGEPTQFLAVGDLNGSGTVQDLTNRVKWQSSDVSVATIDQAGLATAVGVSSTGTTITAVVNAANGSVLTATSTLTSTTGGGSVTLPSLSVYKVGGGTGTLSSAPAGLTCNPQNTCTGFFPLHSVVTLTAQPSGASTFGGWSANCVPGSTPTQCTVTMGNNETVGAIFNTP